MFNNQNFNDDKLDEITKNGALFEEARMDQIAIDANDYHEALKKLKHLDILSKRVQGWVQIFNLIFPIVKRSVALTLLIIYFFYELWNGSFLSKVVDFALNTAGSGLSWNLLIICATITSFYFINKKYK